MALRAVLAAAAAAAAHASRNATAGDAAPANDAELIAAINQQPGLTWRAGPSEFWAGKTVADVRKLLGTQISPSGLRLPVAEHTTRGLDEFEPPASFDAREKWAQCPTIGTIRNQGGCGSCWAFGATEALEDRFCVAGDTSIEGKCTSVSVGASEAGGSDDPAVGCLSPQFLIDCNTDAHRSPPDGGCGGGFLDNAWEFLEKTGIPIESCDPYTECAYPPFSNCTKPGVKPVPAPAKKGDRCPLSKGVCDDGSPIKTFKAKSAYAVGTPGDVAAIQKEIMTNGPVEVAFFVFSDFRNYKSGVYQKSDKAQGPEGGHAVKALGWGTEGGVDYWLIANSWSPNWGEDGFFKIVRGKNECGIETTVAAGLPDTSTAAAAAAAAIAL